MKVSNLNEKLTQTLVRYGDEIDVVDIESGTSIGTFVLQ